MGIIIQFHYKPIYKFKIGKKLSKLPSEKYYRTAISLPIYVGLRKNQQVKIVNSILNYIKGLISNGKTYLEFGSLLKGVKK